MAVKNEFIQNEAEEKTATAKRKKEKVVANGASSKNIFSKFFSSYD